MSFPWLFWRILLPPLSRFLQIPELFSYKRYSINGQNFCYIRTVVLQEIVPEIICLYWFPVNVSDNLNFNGDSQETNTHFNLVLFSVHPLVLCNVIHARIYSPSQNLFRNLSRDLRSIVEATESFFSLLFIKAHFKTSNCTKLKITEETSWQSMQTVHRALANASLKTKVISWLPFLKILKQYLAL